MEIFSLIGIIGGILGVVLYMPQIIKILKTKSAKDLSIWTWVVILANDILWSVWGFGTGNMVVWVPNCIATGLSILTLVLKSRYG